MHWSTYVSPIDRAERVGLVSEGRIYGLSDRRTLIDLLPEPDAMAAAAEQALADPLEVVELADADVLAPVPRPPSVRDFYAFESHVLACSQALDQPVNPDWYELPVFYFQSPQATRGYRADVELAPGSQRFDFELEVAVVIGRAGKDMHPDEAEDHIGGYLLMSDWSARDVQAREMKQTMGPVKAKDTATSYGPYLVTPDELVRDGGNAFSIPLTASVNGRRYSEGNLRDLYWSFGQLLAYASRGTRLVPGDVIGSGTVGTGCILELSLVHGVTEYPFLAEGDLVELTGEGLGTIVSRITAGSEPIPLR